MQDNAAEKPEILSEIQVPRQPLAYLDLTAFDTETPSAEGKRVVLVNPKSGKPLKSPAGEDVAIWIAGPDSPQFRRAVAAHAAEQDGYARAMNPDERRAWQEDPQARYEAECSLVARLVVQLSGIGDRDGEIAPDQHARIKALLVKTPAFLEQIYAGAGGGSRLPFLPD